jgi:hypothetical protein
MEVNKWVKGSTRAEPNNPRYFEAVHLTRLSQLMTDHRYRNLMDLSKVLNNEFGTRFNYYYVDMAMSWLVKRNTDQAYDTSSIPLSEEMAARLHSLYYEQFEHRTDMLAMELNECFDTRLTAASIEDHVTSLKSRAASNAGHYMTRRQYYDAALQELVDIESARVHRRPAIKPRYRLFSDHEQTSSRQRGDWDMPYKFNRPEQNNEISNLQKWTEHPEIPLRGSQSASGQQKAREIASQPRTPTRTHKPRSRSMKLSSVTTNSTVKEKHRNNNHANQPREPYVSIYPKIPTAEQNQPTLPSGPVLIQKVSRENNAMNTNALSTQGVALTACIHPHQGSHEKQMASSNTLPYSTVQSCPSSSQPNSENSVSAQEDDNVVHISHGFQKPPPTNRGSLDHNRISFAEEPISCVDTLTENRLSNGGSHMMQPFIISQHNNAFLPDAPVPIIRTPKYASALRGHRRIGSTPESAISHDSSGGSNDGLRFRAEPMYPRSSIYNQSFHLPADSRSQANIAELKEIGSNQFSNLHPETTELRDQSIMKSYSTEELDILEQQRSFQSKHDYSMSQRRSSLPVSFNQHQAKKPPQKTLQFEQQGNISAVHSHQLTANSHQLVGNRDLSNPYMLGTNGGSLYLNIQQVQNQDQMNGTTTSSMAKIKSPFTPEMEHIGLPSPLSQGSYDITQPLSAQHGMFKSSSEQCPKSTAACTGVSKSIEHQTAPSQAKKPPLADLPVIAMTPTQQNTTGTFSKIPIMAPSRQHIFNEPQNNEQRVGSNKRRPSGYLENQTIKRACIDGAKLSTPKESMKQQLNPTSQLHQLGSTVPGSLVHSVEAQMIFLNPAPNPNLAISNASSHLDNSMHSVYGQKHLFSQSPEPDADQCTIAHLQAPQSVQRPLYQELVWPADHYNEHGRLPGGKEQTARNLNEPDRCSSRNITSSVVSTQSMPLPAYQERIEPAKPTAPAESTKKKRGRPPGRGKTARGMKNPSERSSAQANDSVGGSTGRGASHDRGKGSERGRGSSKKQELDGDYKPRT